VGFVVVYRDWQRGFARRALSVLPDGNLRSLDALNQAGTLFRPVLPLSVEDALLAIKGGPKEGEGKQQRDHWATT
jgi:hypothetical protein